MHDFLASDLRFQSLVDWFAEGEVASPADWRIGSEHERFLFRRSDRRPLPYRAEPASGDGGQATILSVLDRLAKEGGWQKKSEAGHITGLVHANGCVVQLEPGGQIELSGVPLRTLHETCAEISEFDRSLRTVCRAQDVCGLLAGVLPRWSLEAVPRLPKPRYTLMRAMMEKTGTRGLDMMHRTATVQVNLDYADEDDMVQKMRIGAALQPVATALFANSPFVEGRDSGFLSLRAHIWQNTDPARCGLPLFVFDDGFGYARWAQYLLDMPMYFYRRGALYQDAEGASFRDALDGRTPLPDWEDGRHVMSLADWDDQGSVAFPELRLRRYIEMRGADASPHPCALPAFWTGLLYSSSVRAAAADLFRGWSPHEIAELYEAVPKQGLSARIGRHKVSEIGRETVLMAMEGLKSRGHPHPTIAGEDERLYLRPILDIAESGTTLAERQLQHFRTEWGGNVDGMYKEAVFEDEAVLTAGTLSPLS